MAGILKQMPGPVRDGAPNNPANYFYERLLRVTVTNTYYAPTSICTDFVASPTVATATLMNSIGLLFRREASGFSVLYDANQRDELLSYLARQTTKQGNWTRLSFALSLNNAYFGNFTRVPTTLDPATRNYYFTNIDAHDLIGGAALLNRDRFVRANELVPTIGTQVRVVVSDAVERVRVLDIAGQRVLHEKRCVKNACRTTIYLDFTELREDKYLIQEIGYDGGVLREQTVLYTAPGQYCFLDLLFMRPTMSTTTGVYPVDRIAGKPAAVVPVNYEIAFEQRDTWWRYYIVLPPKSKADNLGIVTEPPGVVTFSGPVPVVIGNAQPAARFIAQSTLPMSQIPPARFTLTSSNGTLVDSMPVASIQQILPLAEPPPTESPPLPPYVYSDIYVYV